jgi:hypothetical protein
MLGRPVREVIHHAEQSRCGHRGRPDSRPAVWNHDAVDAGADSGWQPGAHDDDGGDGGAFGESAVGWLYHLFNSAVIGALFGALLGTAGDATTGRNVACGAGWGVVWWVVGALILMPLLLGMPAFAALRMPPMRPVAMGSMVGHLIYGVILGLAYTRLRRGVRMEPSAEVRAARGR